LRPKGDKSFLQRAVEKVLGAKTIQLVKSSNPCPFCDNNDCHFQVHLDSYGNAEMLVLKCPKCGEVKRLYQGRRAPRYQHLISERLEQLTGTYTKPRFPGREV
jgi:phage FluMu protein Com